MQKKKIFKDNFDKKAFGGKTPLKASFSFMFVAVEGKVYLRSMLIIILLFNWWLFLFWQTHERPSWKFDSTGLSIFMPWKLVMQREKIDGATAMKVRAMAYIFNRDSLYMFMYNLSSSESMHLYQHLHSMFTYPDIYFYIILFTNGV